MTRRSLSNAWFPRDPGFSYWVLDMFRCKRLLGNVEVTFMEEAPWIAMTCFTSRSRWKPRKMLNAFCDVRKNVHFKHSRAVADSSPASIPLPLRVEPKPKSGIRQQDVLKRVLEVKPKKQKVSRGSDGSNSISSTQAIPSSNSDSNQEKQKDILPAKPNDTGNETKVDNPIKSLVAAYESSDDED
ncbi:hypothetical protein AABB24_011498 [Solanum stoloniferum]|uniref:Uncharacterized protein n=1 Tax=Solanum stoloniferum TaxID=62892 RepID=A0ABD2UF23_9SOLN